MVLLQLIGQGAFVAASIVLGAKLLLLWRRTGELPELSLGTAFLVGGGFGYLAWFLAGIVGYDAPAFHAIAVVGLGFTCGGALCFGVGVARIFRAGVTWPLIGLALIGTGMVVAWYHVLTQGLTGGTSWFWTGLNLAIPIYLWGAAESISVAVTLHRRARLGLADPIVVNRLAQWGIAGIASTGMFVLSYVSMRLHGPVPPSWVTVVNAGFGLTAATTIWLGFFPPQSLRERLVRAYAS